MNFTSNSLEEALATLGELLAERGDTAELVVVGGGSLLLLGMIERPTKDLDVVALVKADSYISAKPFPKFLTDAVADVGSTLGLAPDWLNAGPTSLLDLGLPAGFHSRTKTRTYDALTLHIAGRFDHICFKLYAAVDQGPRSKHAADLAQLGPTEHELKQAGDWCKTHDASEGFAQTLEQALLAFGTRNGA